MWVSDPVTGGYSLYTVSAVCKSSACFTSSPIPDVNRFQNFGSSDVGAVISNLGFDLHLPNGL